MTLGVLNAPTGKGSQLSLYTAPSSTSPPTALPPIKREAFGVPLN